MPIFAKWYCAVSQKRKEKKIATVFLVLFDWPQTDWRGVFLWPNKDTTMEEETRWQKKLPVLKLFKTAKSLLKYERKKVSSFQSSVKEKKESLWKKWASTGHEIQG